MNEILAPKNIIIYLLVINIVNFFLMWYDKKEAEKHEWRVQEKTFFIISVLGGAIGGLIGMYTFHHKTKKWYFKFGFIGIIITQIVIIAYFMSHNNIN